MKLTNTSDCGDGFRYREDRCLNRQGEQVADAFCLYADQGMTNSSVLYISTFNYLSVNISNAVNLFYLSLIYMECEQNQLLFFTGNSSHLCAYNVHLGLALQHATHTKQVTPLHFLPETV